MLCERLLQICVRIARNAESRSLNVVREHVESARHEDAELLKPSVELTVQNTTESSPMARASTCPSRSCPCSTRSLRPRIPAAPQR